MTVDPKLVRALPISHGEERIASPITHMLPVAWRWEALARALERVQPKALGMMLSFASQMHFYAYREASERGIYTAIAMPTNPGAMSGLMRSVEIEMVLVNDAGARALEQDLREQGELSRIKLWFVVSPKDAPSDFVPASGEVIYEEFP